MINRRKEAAKVWSIAWPLILTNILNVFVGTVDFKMVGSLGVPSIAAVGMARQVMNLLFVIMLAISGGTSVLIARAYGSGDKEKVSHIAAKSLIYMIGAAFLIVTPLGILTAKPFLRGLGASTEVTDLGSSYLKILFAGSLFTMFNFGIRSVLLGVGKTRISLVLLIFVNGLNLLFNFILIYGIGPIPSFGVDGAAWGTVLARGIGSVVGLFLLKSSRFVVSVSFRSGLKLDINLLFQIFKLGGPRSLQGIIRNLSRLISIRIITLLTGATVLISAYSVSMQVRMYSTFVGLAFMQAAAVRISQNMGAGKKDEAAECGWISGFIASVFMSLFAVVFLIFPDEIMGFFTDDPQVIEGGRSFFMIIALGEPVLAFSLALGGALRGGGDSLTPFIYSSFSDLVIVGAVGYILAVTLGYGLTGMAVALSVSALTRAVPITLRYGKGKWKEIALSV